MFELHKTHEILKKDVLDLENEDKNLDKFLETVKYIDIFVIYIS